MHTVPEIGTRIRTHQYVATPQVVWEQVVPLRGYTQVRDPATGAPLLERRLEQAELERQHHSGFAVRAVPGRAAGTGYANASDYEKLTRQQRADATKLTHNFGVVAVTTQPNGTGSRSLQQSHAERTKGVRQVGSAGHTVPRGAAEGNRAAALTRPFNQTALHARSAERREKANAENALAQQRRGMHGPGAMSVSGGGWRWSHARNQVVDRQRSEDVQQCLLRGAAAWAIGRVGQKPSDTFDGSSAQQLLQVKSNGDTTSTGDSARLGSQWIEGRDLRWWLHSWQHWHQTEDRRLSGCTDFDAMHFAKTRRVRLGGTWG